MVEDFLQFSRVVERLPLRLETDHFRLHYGLRNPHEGMGLGPHGVPDRALVHHYAAALERLYTVMRQPPWSRPAPLTNSDAKTKVYICDLSMMGGGPFTTRDADHVPFISLHSRSYEPMNDAAMRRAAAEAVHEGTHVFNYTQRPLDDDTYSSWWEWYDEGLAVLMESWVLPGNRDHFRFL